MIQRGLAGMRGIEFEDDEGKSRDSDGERGEPDFKDCISVGLSDV